MAEPIAALTDYAIAFECLLLAGWLLRLGRPGRLWAIAFGTVATAAVLGGTYHGFAEAMSQQTLWTLWQGTVLALAIASFFIAIAAVSQSSCIWRFWGLILATIKLILLLKIGSGSDAFLFRVIDYLSALGWVLIVQLEQSAGQKPVFNSWPRVDRAWAWMAAGIAISGLAACLLILPWPTVLVVSPLAGYHLVQMVALYCIYRSVSAIARCARY